MATEDSAKCKDFTGVIPVTRPTYAYTGRCQ